MTGSALVIKGTGEVATSDAINNYLTEILRTLPDSGEGDITGLLAQIINADAVEDLDSPWQSAGMGKYAGYAIEITSIKRMESTYSGGLGWYLLAEGTVLETGEYKAFSTSSVSVMAQLLIAYAKGWFPFKVYIRIATKPTKQGFYPMHLEIYRGGPLVDVEENASPVHGRLSASAGRSREERYREQIKTEAAAARAKSAAATDEKSEF